MFNKIFLGTILFFTGQVFAFTVQVHQNMPEEAFIFMELNGTNQQRWVSDYVKAKTEGRYSGQSVNIGYTAAELGHYGNDIQQGAIGFHRVGGVKPDFFKDAFWDDLLFFNWHVPDLGLYSNNFTSWYHFINLLKTNDDGDFIKNNNYNDYDGYAYNATYGFPDVGIDWTLATFMNNAQMSVNLPACTHSNCGEWAYISSGIFTNPAIDYKQNGSLTPVGYPGSSDKKTDQSDGTNYNCFSDVAVIGNCPDAGAELGGSMQIPNVAPGKGDFFSGDQDWVVYEPADNAATFYYNELWLEGNASRNNSLQTASAVGRYYNIAPIDILYFTVVHHWNGDMTQQAHIWSTIGYNHGDYETYSDEKYGERTVGGSDSDKNWENYDDAIGYINARQNRYNLPVGNIDKILMEQAFLTYHIRFRSGYDFLTDGDHAVWKRAGMWAVRNAMAIMAITTEKAVMDIRKCRNSASCNNQ